MDSEYYGGPLEHSALLCARALLPRGPPPTAERRMRKIGPANYRARPSKGRSIYVGDYFAWLILMRIDTVFVYNSWAVLHPKHCHLY